MIGLPAGSSSPGRPSATCSCAAAELAALALAGPRINTEIDAAASHLVGAATGWSRVTRERDRRGRSATPLPVIFGSDLTTPVA